MIKFPIQRINRLGVETPPRIAALQATWDAAWAAANAQPSDDLRQALIDGTLTADTAAEMVTAAAARAAAREHALTITRDLEHVLIKLEAEAVRESADQMIEGMRPRFDELVNELKAALTVVGTATPAEAAQAGPAVVEAMQARDAAVRELDDVRRVVTALGQAGYGPAEPLVAWFLADARRLNVAQSVMAEGRFVALVSHDFELRLNTAAEVGKLITTDQRAAQKAADAEARQKEAEKAERKAELERERTEVEQQRRAMLKRAGVLR